MARRRSGATSARMSSMYWSTNAWAAKALPPTGFPGATTGRTGLADGTTLTVPAPQTDVVDTIGAGDTFNAGILAHLAACDQMAKAQARHLDHDTLRDAMTLAVRAAAVTVSRAGADSPTRAELSETA